MSCIFILEDDKTSIKLIETTKESISSIEDILNIDIEIYKMNSVEFDGSYKPDDDESLKIENFDLSNEIKEAVNNPLGVEKLNISANEDMNIRAVFLSIHEDKDDEKIIFQRTQKRQLLIGRQLTLFWDKDTFALSKKPGIVITDSVDAYYENGTLYFRSYYRANQIFDLNKYYKQATNEEIRNFCQKSCFYIDDPEAFIENSNSRIRKKIHHIMRSNVLEKNPFEYIIKKADSLGLKFEINDNKIIFPKDPKSQKELLSYLSDEIYEGNLSDDIYLTNSKIKLK